MKRSEMLFRAGMISAQVFTIVLSLALVLISSEVNTVAWLPYCLASLAAAYFLGYPIGKLLGNADKSDFAAPELARILYSRETQK